MSAEKVESFKKFFEELSRTMKMEYDIDENEIVYHFAKIGLSTIMAKSKSQRDVDFNLLMKNLFHKLDEDENYVKLTSFVTDAFNIEDERNGK